MLRAGNVYVKELAEISIEGCCSKERVSEVIHGIIKAGIVCHGAGHGYLFSAYISIWN